MLSLHRVHRYVATALVDKRVRLMLPCRKPAAHIAGAECGVVFVFIVQNRGVGDGKPLVVINTS
jgi:hypothetical protein